MPTDKVGKFHLNSQRAMASDKMPTMPKMPTAPSESKTPGAPAANEHEQSPVHEHLKAMHDEMGGKHMHVHSKGDGTHTTHHIGDDGEVMGPDEHGDTESMKEHVGSVMGDGETMMEKDDAPMPAHHGMMSHEGY